MSDEPMSPDLAFRVGLLLGELAKRGMNAVPIMNDNGFTDAISVRLEAPFSHVTLTLTVTLDE